MTLKMELHEKGEGRGGEGRGGECLFQYECIDQERTRSKTEKCEVIVDAEMTDLIDFVLY